MSLFAHLHLKTISHKGSHLIKYLMYSYSNCNMLFLLHFCKFYEYDVCLKTLYSIRKQKYAKDFLILNSSRNFYIINLCGILIEMNIHSYKSFRARWSQTVCCSAPNFSRDQIFAEKCYYGLFQILFSFFIFYFANCATF